MKHIVLDIEMNKVDNNSEGRKLCSNETIEIGAVMLDDDLKVISSFKTYVRPVFSKGIQRKITKLTGITDQKVIKAPVFNEAIKMFSNWCLESGDDIKIYAWSENDYRQIKKEISVKEYEIEDRERSLFETEWSDFQAEFDSKLGFMHNLSLKMALEMAGIEFSGREHDALDDARNTAELLQVFRDENLFELTLKKIKEAMEPTSTGYSIGDMFDLSAFACA